MREHNQEQEPKVTFNAVKGDLVSGDKITQNGNFGIGVNKGTVNSQNITGATDSNLSNHLSEIAADIQQLLEKLDKSYPVSSTSEKMVVAAEAVKQIEQNPQLTGRVIRAVKAGSLQALEQMLSHPVASFVMAALEDWQTQK